MRKPAFPFHCDGCGAQGVDMAYICSTCEYMVHKRCVSLPTILPTDHHHHHLSLAFSFPKEHRKYDYKCEVCDRLLDRTCWVYFCGDCRYFVHIKCVGSSTKPHSNLIEDDDGVIEFPLYANDITNKLITSFVMREKGVENNSTPFLFEYHEHSLSLVSEAPAAADDDELKICDVCVSPISSPPYYKCPTYGCTYFIHSICCLLPITLHSSSSNPYSQLYGDCQETPHKNHKFTLYTPSKSKGGNALSYWFCNMCDVPTNGTGYECEECTMQIDVKCASLPTTIRHASHPHHKPLLFTPTPPQEEGGETRKCRGCNYGFSIGYYCSDENCDFALGLECVLLPKSIREREWDKHPLLLTFDASLDHPSDFFCELCEEEMYPKKWMYHCRQCDVSFHLFCLRNASGAFRNMKFGGRYELDGIHPNHPLTFTYVTLKRRCDLCNVNVYRWLGFECASCYYVVCEDCGGKELARISDF